MRSVRVQVMRPRVGKFQKTNSVSLNRMRDNAIPLKKFHNTEAKNQEQTAAMSQSIRVEVSTPEWWRYYTDKFMATSEISVSKLFPGGFGWQGMAFFAGSQGFAATSIPFALLTGVGDAVGVGVGHLAFNLLKSSLGWKVDFQKETQTSIWLATAAMCSGTAWQPTLNFFHDTMQMNFIGAALSTGAICGVAFFGGLTLGRALYSEVFKNVAPVSAETIKQDAGLSVGVAGAAAMFVGTDVSFADNFLVGSLGVPADMGQLQGMVRAGKATCWGFFYTHVLAYLGLALSRAAK